MNEVVIFYLSFDVDTYTPVTVDLIEKQAECRIVLPSDSNRVRDLRALFDRATDGSFDNRVVRVKALGLVAQHVFVDIDGGVLRGKKEGRLAASDFDALRSTLATLAKEHGCGE